MAECMICGMESDTLYKCKSCGDSFCGNECGSVSERLCLYCVDDDEDYPDEESEEYDDDDDEW